VHSGVIALASGGDGFVQRFAGDESARHAARGAIGSDPIGKTFAFGKLEQRRPEHVGVIMAAWNAETSAVPTFVTTCMKNRQDRITASRQVELQIMQMERH